MAFLTVHGIIDDEAMLNFPSTMFIKSYDICYIVQEGESEMKKSCITRKESDEALIEPKRGDLLDTGILILLDESPRELRKKEASKPLYLTRYE